MVGGLVVVSLLFILHFNMMLCSVLTSLHDVHASGVRPGRLANVEQTVDHPANHHTCIIGVSRLQLIYVRFNIFRSCHIGVLYVAVCVQLVSYRRVFEDYF